MDILISNSLRLTGFRRSDQAALIEHLAEKEIYDRTLRIPYPYTQADAEQWLGIVEEREKSQRPRTNWAIRNGEENLIGGIGLDVATGQPHRAEIGYWLAKPFWGQGIMTAVVTAVCRHAFEKLELAKITANVFAFNDASVRVLEKCGFEQEGYLQKHYFKDGRWIDARILGLIRQDVATN